MQQLQIGDFVDFVDPASLSGDQQIRLSETARWYCAFVRPNRHRRAELELQRLGFRSFYPRTRRWISHARVKKAEERPILGRYLFVEVDHPTQSFRDVTALFDVEGFVSNPNPLPFPSRLVEGFIRRYLAGEWDEVAKGTIPVGARIRIMEGEFQDALATVVSQKGRRIDFKLMGDSKVARTNLCSVRAA
ncbi:transcription termination/antitermination protein NusG [Nitrobacteraceae bacterium UC4446_H13]